jgi:hypothetical protein
VRNVPEITVPDLRSEKQQKLDDALDNIRAKYGKDAIKRGRFL